MPTSRHISVQFNKGTIWDLRITAEHKDPDEYDAKAIVNAVIEMAALQLIELAEARLQQLKGNQSRSARAERKHLKTTIESHQMFIRRLHNPRMQIEMIGRREPNALGVKSIPTKRPDIS